MVRNRFVEAAMGEGEEWVGCTACGFQPCSRIERLFAEASEETTQDRNDDLEEGDHWSSNCADCSLVHHCSKLCEHQTTPR